MRKIQTLALALALLTLLAGCSTVPPAAVPVAPASPAACAPCPSCAACPGVTPPVPAFAVTLGGRCDASGARFGRLIGRVPATALPALLGDLAVDFASNRSPGETWLAYVDRSDPARFEALAARCAAT